MRCGDGMDRTSDSRSRVAVARPSRKTGRAAGTGQREAVLRSLDMTQSIEKKLFRYVLEKQQGRLNRFARRARERGVSTVAVFEGWDAAGKGSALRRVTGALDARDSHVIPIAAPTDEERAHHYLWRFWRHLSRAGELTIFDRSWYGRVLVERVEGFATIEEYQRAYAKATISRNSWLTGGSSWSSSGCTSRRTNSSAASESDNRPRTSAGRSQTRTGATAGSGTPTSRPSRRW